MKNILILLLVVFSTPYIYSQEVECLSAYIKPNGTSRYVISLADNSIWWADPNDGQWTKVSTPK